MLKYQRNSRKYSKYVIIESHSDGSIIFKNTETRKICKYLETNYGCKSENHYTIIPNKSYEKVIKYLKVNRVDIREYSNPISSNYLHYIRSIYKKEGEFLKKEVDFLKKEVEFLKNVVIKGRLLVDAKIDDVKKQVNNLQEIHNIQESKRRSIRIQNNEKKEKVCKSVRYLNESKGRKYHDITRDMCSSIPFELKNKWLIFTKKMLKKGLSKSSKFLDPVKCKDAPIELHLCMYPILKEIGLIH